MKMLIYLITFFFAGNFFDLSLPSVDGPAIRLSQFKGKQILLVNIASESHGIVQMKQLDSLSWKYKKDLVIIAIPSNSFGKEPMGNAEINNFYKMRYNPHFIITAKGEVTGENAISVYKWLYDPKMNGLSSIQISENFQKILINGDGKIIGLFSGSEDPMGESIQGAINSGQ